MYNIDFRQIVGLLITGYLLYKFIGKPIIGLIIVSSNAANIINIKKNNTSIIIEIPDQEKTKKNIAEIVSTIILFIILLVAMRNIYALVIAAGFLSIVVESITPRIYKKINGFYSEYLVFNKKIPYRKIHSWKRVEDNKTISFLGMDGLRFDVFMGTNYEKCVIYLYEQKIKEE